MPNEELVETVKLAGKEAYRLTAQGISELGKCARVGMTHTEIGDYFGVSRQWIERQLETNAAVGQHYRHSEASGAREVRTAIHEVAIAGDAQMLKFVGERRLKMRQEVEVSHSHVVRVIGSQPNYKLSAKDWQQEFAPPDGNAVVDAEFTALPPPAVVRTVAEETDVSVEADTAGRVREEPVGEEGT